MTLDSIIERLEKADGGDRELDADIAVNIVGMSKTNRLAEYPDCQPLWGFTDGSTEGSAEVMVPRYTSSVDAAIALSDRVLPDRTWGFLPSFYRTHPYAAYIGAADRPTDLKEGIIEPGKTPAIALCLAILKAKQMGVGE